MALDALEVEMASDVRGTPDLRSLEWTPIIAGALTACAASLILTTFAATAGLGVSSSRSAAARPFSISARQARALVWDICCSPTGFCDRWRALIRARPARCVDSLPLYLGI